MLRKCKVCDRNRPIDQFQLINCKGKAWRLNTCFACMSIIRNEKRRDKIKDYNTSYYQTHRHECKVRGYIRVDTNKGYRTITMEDGCRLLYNAACHYCGSDNQDTLGLDRIDNKDGHHPLNVVVSCETCNIILGDIPFPAKELLAEGLTNIRRAGLLSNYVIKTKRRNKI
jgi:hypothetical protein